ncbi:MAG: signal peptidase I [Anaerolineae bacterium]|nr:signal peptidase I [Anaerolineae bacterium]
MDEITPQSIEPIEPAAAPPVQRRARGLVSGALRDLFGTILPAVVIALLIHAFLAQATRVYGQSMEPNLHTNERLVVEKLSYRFHGPRRGDIVVLHDPTGGPELLIKRVVGLPGERVAMSDGRVYIDGTPLEEPYLAQPTLGQGRSWLVPPLSVFVMGDNRGASRDSRVFGSVPMEQIIGRAAFRYWPPEGVGVVP